MTTRMPTTHPGTPARPRARRAAHAVSCEAVGVRSPVAAARLVRLAQQSLRALRVRDALVSITLVTSKAMATLNRRHLGHRGPTDVITFAMGTDPNGVVLADVYVCLDVARAQARAYSVGIREELARLVVHGVLHACGWDHPTDASRTESPMWRRQEALLKRFWLSSAARE